MGLFLEWDMRLRLKNDYYVTFVDYYSSEVVFYFLDIQSKEIWFVRWVV